MYIANYSNFRLRAQHDGRGYTLPPQSKLEVPEDVGFGLLRELNGYGVVALKWGEDEAIAKRRALEDRLGKIQQILRDQQSYYRDCKAHGMPDAEGQVDVDALIEEKKEIIAVLGVSEKKPTWTSPDAMLAKVSAAIDDRPAPDAKEFQALDEYLDKDKWPERLLKQSYATLKATIKDGKKLSPQQESHMIQLERAASMRKISLGG